VCSIVGVLTQNSMDSHGKNSQEQSWLKLIKRPRNLVQFATKTLFLQRTRSDRYNHYNGVYHLINYMTCIDVLCIGICHIRLRKVLIYATRTVAFIVLHVSKINSYDFGFQHRDFMCNRWNIYLIIFILTVFVFWMCVFVC